MNLGIARREAIVCAGEYLTIAADTLDSVIRHVFNQILCQQGTFQLERSVYFLLNLNRLLRTHQEVIGCQRVGISENSFV
jgi:hypothetical protein